MKDMMRLVLGAGGHGLFRSYDSRYRSWAVDDPAMHKMNYGRGDRYFSYSLAGKYVIDFEEDDPGAKLIRLTFPLHKSVSAGCDIWGDRTIGNIQINILINIYINVHISNRGSSAILFLFCFLKCVNPRWPTCPTSTSIHSHINMNTNQLTW